MQRQALKGKEAAGKPHLLSRERVITRALEWKRAWMGHLPGPATEVPSSCLCQSVLGIRSPQVFHLVLDMLDVEKNTSVKKSVRHPCPPLPPASPTLLTQHAL